MSDWQAALRDLKAKNAAPGVVSPVQTGVAASVAKTIPHGTTTTATPAAIKPKPFSIGTKLSSGAVPASAPAVQTTIKPKPFTINKTPPVASTLALVADAPAQAVKAPVNVAQVSMEIPKTPTQGQIGDDTQSEKYSSEQMQGLADALKLLEDGITKPQIVGAAIRNVLVSLQSNPNLCAILADADCGLMVRGLRQSYGIIVAKKDEKFSKRAEKEATADDILDGLELTVG